MLSWHVETISEISTKGVEDGLLHIRSSRM